MSEIAIWLLMLVGTIPSAILFGGVQRVSLNRRQVAIWVTIGFLGAGAPPSAALWTDQTWARWIGAGLGVLLLIAWLGYFQVASARALNLTSNEKWRGFAAGCSVSVGYALVAVELTSSQTLDQGDLDTAAGLWIGSAAVWLLQTYRRMVEHQDDGMHRRELDRVFIATYLMYVGQLVAVLAGIGLLHFVPSSYKPPSPLWWVLGAVIVLNSAILLGRRLRGRSNIWTTSSTVLFASACVAAVSVLQVSAGIVLSGTIGVLSGLALFDSIWASGFRLNNRRVSVLQVILAVMAAGAAGAGVFLAYGLLFSAPTTYDRNQMALFVIAGLIMWFGYLVAVSLLVAAPDRDTLTQNGPVFNMIHDSVMIVAALWMGFMSFGWGGYSWRTLIGFGLALGGIAYGVIPMIRAGVETQIHHVESPQSARVDHRRFVFHTWTQWSTLLLIAAVPWAAIPLSLG